MSEGGELALVAAGVLCAVLVLWRMLHPIRSPEEKERLRRLAIHREGRLGVATVIEASDNILFYTYSIGGVEYTASQDVSIFKDQLPEELDTLIGPATVKYVSKNPFNSILICEGWTGFRKQEGSR
jgi:hypothetical protein